MKEIKTDLLDAAYAMHTVLHKAEQTIRHLQYDQKINENCLFQMQEVAKETTKQIDSLKNLVDAQGQQGTWNTSPYHIGLFNGLEMALSIFEKREPKFRDVPNAVGGQFPKSDANEVCPDCDQVVNLKKHNCGKTKVSTSSDDVIGAYEYEMDRHRRFSQLKNIEEKKCGNRRKAQKK